jgi:hypothetical protein
MPFFPVLRAEELIRVRRQMELSPVARHDRTAQARFAVAVRRAVNGYGGVKCTCSQPATPPLALVITFAFGPQLFGGVVPAVDAGHAARHGAATLSTRGSPGAFGPWAAPRKQGDGCGRNQP